MEAAQQQGYINQASDSQFMTLQASWFGGFKSGKACHIWYVGEQLLYSVAIGPEKSEFCPHLSFSSPPRCPNFDLKFTEDAYPYESLLIGNIQRSYNSHL